MIKSFFVENYCSIKNRLDVSFEASTLTDETVHNNFFDYQGKRILKAVSFYGMNATGKTTIIKALKALRDIVVPNFNPFNPYLLRNQTPYHPFELSNDTKNKPIGLGLEFSLDNDDDSYLYKYSVSYDELRIIEEKLEKKTSQKLSLVFKRTTDENEHTEITFGQTVSNVLFSKVPGFTVMPNVSFLSTFSFLKLPDFSEAYKFFAERLIYVSSGNTGFADVVPTELTKNEGLKEFTIKLLKAADFNITGFSMKKKKTKFGSSLNGLVAEKNALFFEHQGDNDSGFIEFADESLGTKKIVLLAERLYPVLSMPSVLIVDELESSLHPVLTRLIVTCFLNEEINVHNSQIIFTSHETSLLDLSLLRRDQINFVYKDQKTCGTYLKSLTDFHVRKGDSIEKAYLMGKYSTSPNVDDSVLTNK